jgi:hypothetical protein
MNLFLKTAGMTVMAASLAACGGGGDDANVNSEPISKNAAEFIINQGLKPITFLTNEDMRFFINYYIYYFISLSKSDGTGLKSMVIPCKMTDKGEGSYTFSLEKSDTAPIQPGVSVGDKIYISYKNCVFEKDQLIYNGTVEIIAKNRMLNLSNDKININFEANFQKYSTKIGSAPTAIFNGIFNINAKADSVSSDFKLFTPVNNSFTLTQKDDLIEYKKGAVFQATREATGDTVGYRTRKLDGEFVVTTAGKTTRFSVSTPIPLSEKKIATSVDEFAATAGTMDVTDLDSGVTTSTTFSDTKAVIRTGGVSYDSTWAALSAAQ